MRKNTDGKNAFGSRNTETNTKQQYIKITVHEIQKYDALLHLMPELLHLYSLIVKLVKDTINSNLLGALYNRFSVENDNIS